MPDYTTPRRTPRNQAGLHSFLLDGGVVFGECSVSHSLTRAGTMALSMKDLTISGVHILSMSVASILVS